MFDVKQHKAELEAICTFTDFYDTFRLVDPSTSEVYALKNGKAIPTDALPCYKIWNRSAPCPNCVSMRTCIDNAQYIKLEDLNGTVLMITTKPVVLEGKKFSLELATDVTRSMFVQDGYHHEQTGIAEMIDKFNDMAIRDLFTGLYNNLYMKSKVMELSQPGRENSFSILVIDIDHFKQVNDLYGHLAGDAVIKEIASELQEFSAMLGCSVGRMGGDEFMVIFEDCGIAEAESFARQIAEKIRTHCYDAQNKEFSIEVSIGTGEYTPGEDVFTFIERADRAMYEVKHIKAAGSAPRPCFEAG